MPSTAKIPPGMVIGRNETYAALVATIDTMPPHSFADQALLNRYFGYRELPAGELAAYSSCAKPLRG